MSKYFKGVGGKYVDPTKALRESLGGLQTTFSDIQTREDKLAQQALEDARWQQGMDLKLAADKRITDALAKTEAKEKAIADLAKTQLGISTTTEGVTNQKAIDDILKYNKGLETVNIQGDKAYTDRMKTLGDKINTALMMEQKSSDIIPNLPVQTSEGGIDYTVEKVKGTQYEKYRDPKTGEEYLLDPDSFLGRLWHGTDKVDPQVQMDKQQAMNILPEGSVVGVTEPRLTDAQIEQAIRTLPKADSTMPKYTGMSDTQIIDKILTEAGRGTVDKPVGLGGYEAIKEKIVPTEVKGSVDKSKEQYKADVTQSIKDWVAKNPKYADIGLKAITALDTKEYKYTDEEKLAKYKMGLDKELEKFKTNEKIRKEKLTSKLGKGADISNTITALAATDYDLDGPLAGKLKDAIKAKLVTDKAAAAAITAADTTGLFGMPTTTDAGQAEIVLKLLGLD